MRHTFGVVGVLGAALLLSACSTQQVTPLAVTVNETATEATPSGVSSPTATVSADTSTRVTGTAITIAAAEPVAHITGDHTVMGCGVPSIHAIGTTFYNDGTTAYTEDCATLKKAQAAAGEGAIRCPGTTTFVTDPQGCLSSASSSNPALDFINNLRLPQFCDIFPQDRSC